MKPDGRTRRFDGHPWRGDPVPFKLPMRLAFYEYHIDQEPYTEGLPAALGYEQGYALPHWYDRGFMQEQHGNQSAFTHGCRCTLCKAARAEYDRNRRAS